MTYPAYQKYKESGVLWLGKVPSHWDVKRLKYMVTCNDETLSENFDPETVIKYVDISSVNLIGGITSIEELEFDKSPSRARRIVHHGDTIVSTVRTYLKAIAAIRNPPENLIVSTGFAVVRPRNNVDPDYLGYFLQSHGFIGEVVSKSVGVSYPAINPTEIVCIESLLPSLAEQKSIAEFLDIKTAEIDALIAGLPTIATSSNGGISKMVCLLQEYRTALITNAVTGKIDVRNHQKKREAA
jgi:type I restriction enzyme S subunit